MTGTSQTATYVAARSLRNFLSLQVNSFSLGFPPELNAFGIVCLFYGWMQRLPNADDCGTSFIAAASVF